MKKIFSIVLIAVLFATACDKKDNSCMTSVASLSGIYKITAVTYKASPVSAEIDYFNILFPDACERDDLYTFQTNGTYQVKDAGTICSPSGDDDGTWSLSGSTIVIDGDPTTLESFDCKTLVIANNDTQTPGDRLKLTLTRQ